MKINIAELQMITERLLKQINTSDHEWIEINDDYYWDIPQQVRYNPYKEPQEHDLGQLTDDWEELSKILHGSAEPINYAFVWLASILRKVGEDFSK